MKIAKANLVAETYLKLKAYCKKKHLKIFWVLTEIIEDWLKGK